MNSSTFVTLLDRQVGRLVALENSPNVSADQTVEFRFAAAIAHQAARGGELAKSVDRGQRMANCQRSELFAVSTEEVVGTDDQRACAELGQLLEHRIEITIAACIHNMQLQPERLSCRLRETRNGPGKGHRRVD